MYPASLLLAAFFFGNQAAPPQKSLVTLVGEALALTNREFKAEVLEKAIVAWQAVEVKAGPDADNDLDYRLLAMWCRAKCEGWLERFEPGIKILEEAVALAEKEKHVLLFELTRELGELRLKTRNFELAQQTLKKALELAEKNPKFKFKNWENTIPKTEIVKTKLMLTGCLMGLGNTYDVQARRELEALETLIEQEHQIALETKGKPEDWMVLLLGCQGQLIGLDLKGANSVGAVRRIEKQLIQLKQFKTKAKILLMGEIGCHRGLAELNWSLARFHDAKMHLDIAESLLKPELRTDQNTGELELAKAHFAIEEVEFALKADAGRGDLLARLSEGEKAARAAAAAFAKASVQPTEFKASCLLALAQIAYLRGRVYELESKSAKEQFEQASVLSERCLKELDNAKSTSHDLQSDVRRWRSWAFLKLGNVDAARTEAEAAGELFKKGGHQAEDVGWMLHHHLRFEIEALAAKPEEAALQATRNRRLAAEQQVDWLVRRTAPEQVKHLRMWDDPALHGSLRLGMRFASMAPVREQSAEWLINGKAKTAELLATNLPQMSPQDRDEYWKFAQQQAFHLYGRPGIAAKDLEEALLSIEGNKRDLAVQIVERRKRDLAADGKTPPLPKWHSLGDLRLKPDEAFIDIFRLRPQENAEPIYCAWIITTRGDANTLSVEIVPLGDAATIDGLVKLFIGHQENCGASDRTVNSFDVFKGKRPAEAACKTKFLAELATLILQPIRLKSAAFEKHRWNISSDGSLWNLPWAALVLPDGKYLIEDIIVRYVISGRDLMPDAAASDAAAGSPWILADPDLDLKAPPPGWGPRKHKAPALAFARQEGEEVAASFKKAFKLKELALQPRTATKSDLFALKSAPRVLYLSTHGLFLSNEEQKAEQRRFLQLPVSKLEVDDPMLFCGLAFAGFNLVPLNDEGKKEQSLPGLLTGAEVLALPLRGTELVVLSACQSGTGVLLPGQSPADLRQAFHLAGAKSVVSSLWSVDDEATARLMVTFVDGLEKQNKTTGKSDMADALRNAQLEMIRSLRNSDEAHAHPYYWAAFTLTGR